MSGESRWIEECKPVTREVYDMLKAKLQPMTFTRLAATLKIKFTPEVAFAAAYLESRGLKFLIHFGTDNAVNVAARLMTSNRLEFVGERHG